VVSTRWFILTVGVLGSAGLPCLAQEWEQVSPALAMNSPQIASSVDGETLLLSGLRITIPLLLSTNLGQTWTVTSAPPGSWDSFAISADQRRLVAASYAPQGIYTSQDGGMTWLSNNVSPAGWTSVAASSDGRRIVAVNNAPQTIHVSTNGGTHWTQATNAPIAIWRSVASSADGSKLVAVNYFPGSIHGSADGGETWTPCTNAPVAAWVRVVSSADGGTLLALTSEGRLYASPDAGATWLPGNLPGIAWNACAASADARTQIVCSREGFIYTSADAGATWQSNAVPSQLWTSVAMSADGSRLFAVAEGGEGGVWRSLSAPAPRLQAAAAEDGLRLGWLVPATDFVLQQSVDVVPTGWEEIDAEFILNPTNLLIEVTLPWSDRGFYRLKAVSGER